MFRSLLFVCLVFSFLQANSQQVLLYKNPALPVEQRVKDLLSRMTPEEKFWQLFMIPGDLDNAKPDQYKNGIFGFQVSASAQAKGNTQQLLSYNTTEEAIALAKKINSIQQYFVEHTRLGIPIIAFDEALHGVVRKGATAFPQSIALAATFATSLMSGVATAIANEARQRGIRQVLSPVINIATDVRWGRTEETYGEDPYLTSAMGVAFTKAFQQLGIITTPKHFLANVGDGGRDSYPIDIDERLLKEIHLPPFKAVIKYGNAGSVMTSYNSVNGSPASANKWLIEDILKKEYDFTGFVISDASAVGGANVLHLTAADYADASKKAMQNGLDVIFQTAYDHYKLFIPPFLNDSISKKRIDDAVSRVLTAKFKLGLFEHPYINIDTTVDLAAHHQLAKEAAAKSFVLLQNKDNNLPLRSSVRSIAVIGEDAIEGRLGGYSGPGNNVVTILKGIQNFAGKKIKVQYAAGTGRNEKTFSVIPNDYLFTDSFCKQKGLKGSYFNSIDLSGTPSAIRTDDKIDFHWTLYGPDNLQVNRFYSVQWDGYVRFPEMGDFKIGLDGNDGYRLFINDTLIIDRWVKQSYHTELTPYHFEKNKIYNIRVEFYEPVGNAEIRLIWNQGIHDSTAQKIKQAVTIAKQSDAVIIVAGINEGEFQDRALLSLPGNQEALIQAIAATGKPVTVLLVGGSAVTMNKWIDKVKSIVELWYPGEAGGDAVAEMLFGKTNPGGKLPITFPLAEGQLPLVYDHKPTGRGDDYNNLSGQPLFPFGFGLSYTSFGYSNMKMNKPIINKDENVTISCDIKNTGSMPGDEVVQLYIHDELASVVRPVIELKAFQRISLQPGETKTVSFTLDADTFRIYNETMQYVTEPGSFRIMIGSSSRDIRMQQMLELK
jgi:beta-glucosidase